MCDDRGFFKFVKVGMERVECDVVMTDFLDFLHLLTCVPMRALS